MTFTWDDKEAYKEVAIGFIAVGAPEKEDGSADLTYIEEAAISIAKNIQQTVIDRFCRKKADCLFKILIVGIKGM